MLICKKCFLEYNEGNMFCSECGSPLSPKQVCSSVNKEVLEEEGGKPKERFICPQCKIIYEKTTACIRCGKEAIPLSSFREAKGGSSEGESEIQVGSKTPKLSEPTKEPLEPKPSFKREIESSETLTPFEVKSEKRIPREEKRQIVSYRVKRDYRQLSLYLGQLVVMAIAGGYILWSLYTHLFSKEVSSKTKNSEESTVQELSSSSFSYSSSPSTPSSSSLSTPPLHVITSFEETETLRKIKELLENLRQANLYQDMELFLSCYSKDFKDRERKKRTILEFWKKFNYTELSYILKRFSLSSDTANAKVVWLVKYSPKSGGPPKENKSTLEVLFQKEEDGWKIKEILSGGVTPH